MSKMTALVWTRPETLPGDIARALSLACIGDGAPPATVTRRTAGAGPAPWIAAAIAPALASLGVAAADGAADGEAAAVPRLHLVAAAVDPRLGAVGCLEALAGAPAARPARKPDAMEDLVDRAVRAAASGVHWFLVDATTVPASDGGRVARNRLLAGTDPVALDCWTARLCGLDPAWMPAVASAAAAGLGVDPGAEALVGDRDDLPRGQPAPWRPRGDASASRLVSALRDLPRRARLGRRGGDGKRPTVWHALGSDLAAGRRPAWEENDRG